MAEGSAKLTLIAGILAAALPLLASAATSQTITLDVKNMTCATCPITVKKSIAKVAGVDTVTIDYAKKTATVTYDPAKARPDEIAHASTNAGYPSALRKGG